MASDWIEKQFNELKKLAEERFAPLSAAESKMLRTAIAGNVAWCGPSQEDDDPHNNPFADEDWGPEREIRAELLRWLCMDKTAEGYVDPQGVRLHGATISDDLNLSGAVLRFPLVLNRCRFPGNIRLVSAELAFLNLSGSFTRAIWADRLKVKGNVFFRGGFTAQGEVRLMGAQIDGAFDCHGGTFKNPAQKDRKESGAALNAQGIRVNGSIHLRGGFQSQGEVWLLGAEIGGNLDCSGGIFKNPAQKDVQNSGTALVAENISVKGDVLLRNGFQAEGEVWLIGARIGGELDCHGGAFKNSPQSNVQASGIALTVEDANVTGSALLCDGFQTDGRLSLVGARIAGDLAFHNGTFDDIIGQRMTVQRTLVWRNIKNPKEATLDLQNASVGSLVDDLDSWPPKQLTLDGFTYGRITEGPKDSTSRLEWLSRQTTFAPQPYRQLAKVLREEGDDPGSRHVLYEMEKRKQREAQTSWLSQIWSLIFRGTIGYGIYPRRALWWLLLLIVLGWSAYWGGYSRRAITPTNKEAYEAFHKNGETPPSYQHFSAFVYSAEHCFPLVNLGQKDAWSPDPNRLGLARALRVFRWSQILLGWALATFFVAGVTGIARKD
jgi:hypothetical protein